MNLSKIIIAVGVFFIASQSAMAYLDPGTGSYLFQALIAALLGSLLALKVFWHRVKNFVRAVFVKDAPGEGDEKS